jgi:hypothetical protein
MKGTATSSNMPVVLALLALAISTTATAQAQTTDASGGSSTTTDDSSSGAVEAAPADAAATESSEEESASEDDGSPETEPASDSDDGEGASGLASGDDDADHDGSPDDEEPDPARSEEEAEAAQATAEPLAWRNTFFSWTMGSTFNTFYRGADLSYNPLYYWAFSFIPRWYFSSNVFLVVNQGLYYELTNDDSASYNHEPQLYDTVIELRATFVADRFIFIPAVRLLTPTSKLSQAAQRYFNTGLTLTTVLNMPEVANGNLALVLSYRRWWGSSVTPLTAGGALADVIREGETTNGSRSANDFGDQIPSDGGTLGVDRLVLGLTWNVTPVEGLTLTLSGFLLWDQGYGVTPVTLGFMGHNEETLGDTTSHWRMFSSYTLQAAYDLAPWFNLGLGISNATNLSPFFASDGSVLSPFNPNTQVFLSATVTLDGIYETITAGGEEDGLTPEERQRRRQGLAAIDEELLDDETAGDDAGDDEDHDTGAVRATGTF